MSYITRAGVEENKEQPLNLKAEIDKILNDFGRTLNYESDRKKSGKQLLQLFDKSVERVIGEDEDVYAYGKPENSARNKLRYKQHQTWNKIKSGEEKV